MIDHKNKVIFIHIPRTGGTSIERMAGILNDRPDKHWSAREIRANCGADIWREYRKFTIVRNPIGRACSCYNWIRKVKAHPSHTDMPFLDWLKMIKRTHPRSNAYKRMVDFLDYDTEHVEILRYETEYKKVAPMFGIKEVCHIVYKTEPRLVDVEEVRLIQDIYRRDFEVFDYGCKF